MSLADNPGESFSMKGADALMNEVIEGISALPSSIGSAACDMHMVRKMMMDAAKDFFIVFSFMKW